MEERRQYKIGHLLRGDLRGKQKDHQLSNICAPKPYVVTLAKIKVTRWCDLWHSTIRIQDLLWLLPITIHLLFNQLCFPCRLQIRVLIKEKVVHVKIDMRHSNISTSLSGVGLLLCGVRRPVSEPWSVEAQRKSQQKENTQMSMVAPHAFYCCQKENETI